MKHSALIFAMTALLLMLVTVDHTHAASRSIALSKLAPRARINSSIKHENAATSSVSSSTISRSASERRSVRNRASSTSPTLDVQNAVTVLYNGSDFYITTMKGNTAGSTAGLLVGDIVTMVNDQDVTPGRFSAQSLSELLTKGAKGTTTKVEVFRSTGRKTFTLNPLSTTQSANAQGVTTDITMKTENNRCTIFVKNFGEKLSSSVAKDLAVGKDCEVWIVDLRHFPGGTVRAVLDFASLILPSGTSIGLQEKQRGSTMTREMLTTKGDMIRKPQSKLFILISEPCNTAAAMISYAVAKAQLGTVIGDGMSLGSRGAPFEATRIVTESHSGGQRQFLEVNFNQLIAEDLIHHHVKSADPSAVLQYVR